MEIYVVKAGDTVYSIAAEYLAPQEEIIFINQLAPPYTLVIGQALLIPAGEAAVSRRAVRINGCNPSLSQRAFGFFLWIYHGRGADSAGLRRWIFDRAGRCVFCAADTDPDAVWSGRPV